MRNRAFWGRVLSLPLTFVNVRMVCPTLFFQKNFTLHLLFYFIILFYLSNINFTPKCLCNLS